MTMLKSVTYHVRKDRERPYYKKAKSKYSIGFTEKGKLRINFHKMYIHVGSLNIWLPNGKIIQSIHNGHVNYLR